MLPLLLESAVRSFLLAGLIWFALRATRIRSIQVQMIAWTGVLLGSFSMPFLMHRVTVTLPAPPAVMKILTITQASSGPAIPAPASPAPHAPFITWPTVALVIYLSVAAVLFLRLLTGFLLTWRLRRQSHILREDWAGDLEVRVCSSLSSPLTLASTIFLPADCYDWAPVKRQAVLSHEASHIQRGDFYMQMLAGIHRAVFWFSPFSWWLWTHLVRLGELASDEAAIAAGIERTCYAEILLDFACTASQIPAGVAMARPATLAERVQRILVEKDVSGRMNRRKQAVVATGLMIAIAFSAGCSWPAQAQDAVRTVQSTSTTTTTSSSSSSASSPASSSSAPVATPESQTEKHAPSKADRRATLSVEIRTATGAYVILSGDSLTMNSSFRTTTISRDSVTNNQTRTTDGAQATGDNSGGDYIWFEQDGKSYYVDDSSTVDRAKRLFEPVEVLGRKQGELGAAQGKLGEAQGRLGQKQGQLAGNGDANGHEEPAKIGEEQAKLGKQQSALGERQSALAEEQRRAAERASQDLRALIVQAQQAGLAKPAH